MATVVYVVLRSSYRLYYGRHTHRSTSAVQWSYGLNGRRKTMIWRK